MQCYDPHEEDPANIRWLPRWPAWCALIVAFGLGFAVSQMFAGINSLAIGVLILGDVCAISYIVRLAGFNTLQCDEIEMLRGEIDILNMRQTP